MFYAGAQKNLGPSGMAVVAIRKDFAEKGFIYFSARAPVDSQLAIMRT